MAKSNTRLELTWIGKENRPKLEPRILLEDPEKSYHAAQRVSDQDLFDNRLIFGDNLLALKALEQEFGGLAHLGADLKGVRTDARPQPGQRVIRSLFCSCMRPFDDGIVPKRLK